MKVAYLLQPKLETGSSYQSRLILQHTDFFQPISVKKIVGSETVISAPMEGFSKPILYPTRSLLEAIDEVNPDVVMIHTISRETVDEVRSITAKYPTALRLGVNFYELMTTQAAFQQMPPIMILADMVDCIICPSKQVEWNLNTIGYQNTVTIPTAVDTEYWGALVDSEREKGLTVSISRLEPIKNHMYMILAAKYVGQVLPSFKYNIYGVGSIRSHLNHIRDTFAAHWVQFKGKCNPPTVLEKAHVFFQMSLSENCSGSLLEAMAAGVPVVASDIPGHAIGNIDKENLDMGVNDIIRLITDEDAWKTRRDEGLRVAKQYDIRRIVPRYKKLFEILLALKPIKDPKFMENVDI